jgi:hypothetical protein
MRFAKAVIYAALALSVSADAKLFGKDKRE